MTAREIKTVGKPSTRIDIPGSKSITNRALVCAALAGGASTILHASDSDDTSLMSNGLNQLGILVRRGGDALAVSGTAGRLFAPRYPIPVGNAGTTLRFLLSLAALAEGRTVFEGSARMADRPIDDLLDGLRQLGVEVQASGARYVVQGGGLRGGRVKLKASKSSQFLSSLLMAAPYASSDVRIEVEGRLSSVPYVHITQAVMEEFGVGVGCDEQRLFNVQSGLRYRPAEFRVEPDASGAAYFFAAAAIAGGEVMVRDLKKSSLQGDLGFLDVLMEMGCDIASEDGGLRVCGTGHLKGIEVDMNAMPDVVPTLAVTALFAETPTRISNVAHLQHKESNRLAATATELSKLGAHVTLSEDGLDITPGPLHGARLDTYDDHRLAMSFSLAGLRVPGVVIENPECVRKSFPGFWGEFEKLG